MAQNPKNMEQYRRIKGATNPFKLNSGGNMQSGSSWGRAELEWLGTDRVFNLGLEEIIDPKYLLPDTCKVAKSLRYEFRMPWSEVKPPTAKLGKGNFYTHLRYVASIQLNLGKYEQSVIELKTASQIDSDSPTSGSEAPQWQSSPPVAGPSLWNLTTPSKQLRSSPPSAGPPTMRQKQAWEPMLPQNVPRINPILSRNPPTPVGSEGSGPGFPPSSPTQRYQPLQSDHTRRRANSPVDLLELPHVVPSSPLFPSMSGHRDISGNTSAWLDNVLNLGEEILKSAADDEKPELSLPEYSDFNPDSIFDQNSDPAAFLTPTKKLSPESQLKHQSEKLENKAESEVERVAVLFFEIIERALMLVVNESVLSTMTRNALALTIQVENEEMTTKPDVDLMVTGTVDQQGTGPGIESTIHIYTECKRLVHHKPADQIFGQEVAHEIAAAVEQKDHGFKKSRYRKYLLSWHHTECYVSCLEVDNDYLDLISTKLIPNRSKSPLIVRQSRRYDMTDPGDRYRISMAILAMVVEGHADYDRYHRSGLLKKLRS